MVQNIIKAVGVFWDHSCSLPVPFQPLSHIVTQSIVGWPHCSVWQPATEPRFRTSLAQGLDFQLWMQCL